MNIHRHSHGDVNIEIENIFNCREEGKLETRLYIFSTKIVWEVDVGIYDEIVVHAGYFVHTIHRS